MLLRVSACGVCHSDLHIADGYFDLGQGQKLDLAPAVKLPRILGHEIAGVVEELGPDATGVRVGDRRAVYAWGGCGSCAQCRAGQENLCAKPRNLSVHADGGFSNYVVVEHPRYLVEYEPLPAPFAATLGCSGLTAFSALKKAAPVEAEHPLLIIGAGGLGLAAVSLCHALYGIGPIVADIDAAKRQAALEAGASAVIDPADPDARKSLLANTGGMFSAIDFVGAEKSAALWPLFAAQRRTLVRGRPVRRIACHFAAHLADSSRQHHRRVHGNATRVSGTHGAGARRQGEAGAN